MSSLLLTGGLVYDGSGNDPFPADLLLLDGKIMQIEPAGNVVFPGVKKQDLSGLSVSPGWIDVHAHSDVSLLAAPEAFGKISQGITTEVSGNCGLSAFPILTGEVREHLRSLYQGYGITPDWTDFNSYAEKLAERKPAVNVIFLCGHNTLRANISGYRRQTLSPHELAEMNSLLAEMLDQGAVGISTGLLYAPGCFSNESELLSLLGIVAGRGGIYATHLRNEGDCLEESLEEAVRLAEKTGVQLQISHLKTALPRNWNKLDTILKMIADARARGISIAADRYPYTYSQTSLSIVLARPYDTMTDTAIREILRQDPVAYGQALRQLSASGRDWSRVILSKSGAPAAAGLSGMTIAAAAEKSGKTPADLVMEILRDDAPGSMAAFGGMSDRNLVRILSQSWVCCGTDETARPADDSLGFSHPRGFGSFPEFIRLLREQEIPMQKIISRLTALPAGIFHLKNRGEIRVGCYADLVVFDEQALHSKADFLHPHTPAAGIRKVFVNGMTAYDGEICQVKVRSGRILRRE
ncbi:MAG: amidohydrolase family protein [Lentisphaeria bacterium]|nr:amidohydrolase family protein [Lentisphaeria bacterium]